MKTKEELAAMSDEELRHYADVELNGVLEGIDKHIQGMLDTRREFSRHYLSVGQELLKRREKEWKKYE